MDLTVLGSLSPHTHTHTHTRVNKAVVQSTSCPLKATASAVILCTAVCTDDATNKTAMCDKSIKYQNIRFFLFFIGKEQANMAAT